jgi:hypothetical protein
MNERDYLIMEAMVLTAGALVLATVVSMYILFDLPVGINLVLILSFIGFTTFFFGLYCHMKRRIFVLEMEALAKNHTDPEHGTGSEK